MELEKEIGLPRSIIYKWNNNKNKSYKSYIGKIAKYFNVPADYLLGNTDIKNKPATDNGNGLSESEAQLIKLFNSVRKSRVWLLDIERL
jgi:transcriptional regulator with XRE-family HTH domain